jgi:hypothetical protein
MAKSKKEKNYKVKDKRRVKLGKDGEVETRPEAEASQQKEESQQTQAEEQPGDETAGMPPIDAYVLLKSFIGLLGAHTWQWIGLMPNPQTGKIDKDLTQAKIAIDSIIMLAKQLEGHLNDLEERDLKDMISNLQINFVQQSERE